MEAMRRCTSGARVAARPVARTSPRKPALAVHSRMRSSSAPGTRHLIKRTPKGESRGARGAVTPRRYETWVRRTEIWPLRLSIN